MRQAFHHVRQAELRDAGSEDAVGGVGGLEVHRGRAVHVADVQAPAEAELVGDASVADAQQHVGAVDGEPVHAEGRHPGGRHLRAEGEVRQADGNGAVEHERLRMESDGEGALHTHLETVLATKLQEKPSLGNLDIGTDVPVRADVGRELQLVGGKAQVSLEAEGVDTRPLGEGGEVAREGQGDGEGNAVVDRNVVGCSGEGVVHGRHSEDARVEAGGRQDACRRERRQDLRHVERRLKRDTESEAPVCEA
mmetsp:Transcript_9534/g.21890  ORF Transcript_9534/g.21890 Transcript_9534/m.21890 type:complete len:251 (+) Transcript_9534:1352-2104(+)